jgi:hypothetical protein
MKSKVNELLELVSKIENGSVTLLELEYSVELARDLYEKLVVVRHKVYEQEILEQPTFDLSPIAFEEEVSVEEKVDMEPISIEIQEPVSEPEPTIFEIESNEEGIHGTPIHEEDAPELEMNLEDDKTEFSEETIIESIDSKVEEIPDFSDDLERPMPEITYNEAPTLNSVDSGSWVEQIKEIESHIPSSFTMSKLDTLIGSFGLNERLQFINELFGGSSEAFSEAVKVLDARTGMDSAREKIAEFAASNNWGDADNETITDFVAKIKRRYA